MGRQVTKVWALCLASLTGAAIFGCSVAPKADARDARPPASRRPKVGADLGLRIAVASDAKSVCVHDSGCAGAPKGSVRIQPLQASIREAVSQALVAAGFELVGAEADRDLLANVEWRGTDTIALRLQDARGRMIDQASFSRRLERCRDLPRLTWDSCWAANFEPMKEELSRPFQSSAALRSFARRYNGSSGADADARSLPTGAVEVLPERTGASPASADRLEAPQVEETIARHREQLRRTCWQPAFEARGPQAPSAARVATTLSIAAAGHVEQVTIGSAPAGYPHLAECVAAQVRAWRFPASNAATTVAVPFVFAGD